MALSTALYEELDGSPSYSFGRKGGSGKRTLLCDWPNRFLVLNDQIPSAYVNGSDIVIPPASTFPGIPSLVADHVEIAPYNRMSGDGSFPATYDKARITISYSTLPYAQQVTSVGIFGPGGRFPIGTGLKATFISHKIKVSGEFLTWPSSAMQYAANANPSSPARGGAQRRVPQERQYSVILPLLEHHITWHNVPFPPWKAIRWLVGNVNAYPFGGAPAETMLFLGADSPEMKWTWDNIQVWSPTYQFTEKNSNQLDPTQAFGWNHHVRANGANAGAWQIVDRIIPKGDSTLTALVLAGDTSFSLASTTSFLTIPSAPGLNVEIINPDGTSEIASVLPPLTNPISFNTRGLFGTSAISHPQGALVQQVILTTLATNIDPVTRYIQVTDANVWPQLGQILVQVDNEIMCIARRWAGSPQIFYVLRGVRGTLATAHTAGSMVRTLNSPGYPLGDFSFLFQSGFNLV
jgi:hypothetical protein